MMRVERRSDNDSGSHARVRVASCSVSSTAPRSVPSLAALADSLAYGFCPAPDIATAGQLTEGQLAELAAAGVRTIIDLRAAPEPRGYDEPDAVRDAGMEYVLIPVTPETLDDATFDRFLAVMRDAAKRPIVVHCATANRVGGLLIPYFRIDERRDEREAVMLAKQVGLRSVEYAAKGLDYARRHGAGGAT
jgi:uncharacterized protein (TIGR01244 family)